MSKKCTPLRREAHVQVQSIKNEDIWAYFDVSDGVLLTDGWIEMDSHMDGWMDR